jgi:hypothetical protein
VISPLAISTATIIPTSQSYTLRKGRIYNTSFRTSFVGIVRLFTLGLDEEGIFIRISIVHFFKTGRIITDFNVTRRYIKDGELIVYRKGLLEPVGSTNISA